MLRAIRARWWLVPLVAVVGLVVGLIVSETDDDREARAIVAFAPLSQNSAVVAVGIDSPAQPAPEQLRSDSILEGLNAGDPADLRERLSVDALGDGRQVELRAQADSGAKAVDLVNSWAKFIAADRNAVVRSKLDAAEQRASDGLEAAPPNSVRSVSFRDLLNRLRNLQDTVGGDTRVVAEAAGSVKANDTPVGAIAALGALAGLLLAVLWGAVDGRLRSPATLRAAFGLPVLATVGSRADDRQAGVALRTKLDAVTGDTENRDFPYRLLVVDANRGGDAQGLARVIADEYEAGEIDIVNTASGGHAALAAVPTADGIVVSARLDETSHADAEALHQWWDGLEANVLGVVAVRGGFASRRMTTRGVRRRDPAELTVLRDADKEAAEAEEPRSSGLWTG